MKPKHRKENETHRKSAEILAYIISACNEKQKLTGSGESVIGFGPDWGGHSLTVFLNGAHSHVGSVADEGTFEQLIDQLHDLLLKGRGLSWA